MIKPGGGNVMYVCLYQKSLDRHILRDLGRIYISSFVGNPLYFSDGFLLGRHIYN